MANATNRRWTDEKMDEAMGHLLRAGVVVAGIVVAIGGTMHVWKADDAPRSEYHIFHGTPDAYRHLATVVQGALHGDSASVIQFGLLLLIATPVARVIFAFFGFLAERDWLYTLVSALVLGILIYSLVSSA